MNKNKIIENLNYHLVDSTALLTLTNPIFSVIETIGSDMSNETSINARILATGLTQIGFGRLFTKGLDISRDYFNINNEATEKMKYLHDSIYAGLYNIAITPAFYYASGARDLKEIALGTAFSIGLAFLSGGVLGYTVDNFRDLAGLKETERIPQFVKKQTPKMKKILATTLVAGSIGLMSGIYAFNPNKEEIETNYQPQIEKAEQNHSSLENIVLE